MRIPAVVDYFGIIKMKRLFLIFAIVTGFSGLTSESKASELPPSMATIFTTVNELWSNKEYSKVKNYIEDLDGKFSGKGYVPVELIKSAFHSYWGAQVEISIRSLADLESSLYSDIYNVSPVFLELLTSRKNKISSSLRAYERCGYSKKYRLEKMNPVKSTSYKVPVYWIDELLYFNAPEIYVSPEGITEARAKEDFDLDGKFIGLSENQLLSHIQSNEYDFRTKKHIVFELVKRRMESKDERDLLKGLNEGASGYTYYQTVKALESDGGRYLPEIRKLLLNPPRFSDNKENFMWALVRMKATDKETLSLLQKISVNSQERPSVRHYAKRALEHLHDVKKLKNN